MSQYKIPDPEDLFECPYDNTHMVRAKRFPYHLMKCRRNYTGNDYATCPFNAKHEMPRPELRFHIAHCDGKAILEQDIIYAQQRLKGEQLGPNYKSDWEPPRSSEDWEKDVPVIPRIGVDPNFLRDKNVIRSLSGMTPAQKKAFHKRILLNFARQEQGLPPLEDEPVETKPEERVGINGLRLPREQPLIMRQLQPQAKPPQQQQANVFIHSLALAGIGRGKTPSVISSTSLPVPGLLGGAKGSSASPQKSGSSRMAANIFNGDQHSEGFASPAGGMGRGIATGMAGIGRGAAPSIGHGVNYEMVGKASTPHTTALGRGNGRGALGYVNSGQPGFIVPKTSVNINRVEDLRSNGGDSDSGSSTTEDSEEAKKKEVRKLNKKLREIQSLEIKVLIGDQLSEEQKLKLQNKEELQRRLDYLR